MVPSSWWNTDTTGGGFFSDSLLGEFPTIFHEPGLVSIPFLQQNTDMKRQEAHIDREFELTPPRAKHATTTTGHNNTSFSVVTSK